MVAYCGLGQSMVFREYPTITGNIAHYASESETGSLERRLSRTDPGKQRFIGG